MSLDAFYVPPSAFHGDSALIRDDELKHLAQVMRKRPGDAVLLVDGEGGVFDAVIASVDRQGAVCTITARRQEERESGVRVILGVGMLKNPARFDFLVEKVTELGVHEIVPLLTSRTVPRHARTDRWQKEALAAMKQSGRAVLPRVAPLTPFADFLRRLDPSAAGFLPHEETQTPGLAQALRDHGRSTVFLCIGPEGGFSSEETRQATEAGFLAVTLGPRRLRTETAAILATALAAGAAT